MYGAYLFNESGEWDIIISTVNNLHQLKDMFGKRILYLITNKIGN